MSLTDSNSLCAGISVVRADYTARVRRYNVAMHAKDIKPLKFGKPVILIGGGELNVAALRSLLARGWPLVAADGGANLLREIDCCPEAIVGDLDSVHDLQYWQSRCRLLHLSEQDSTDFEKCLYSISAPAIIALGFTGKRFDHTLAALHAMSRYGREQSIIVIAEQDLLWVRDQSTHLVLRADMRLSIYPLSRVAFESSRGLEYPLDGLVMEQGTAIGTSNRTVDANVEIRTQADNHGLYLLIVPLDAVALVLQQWR